MINIIILISLNLEFIYVIIIIIQSISMFFILLNVLLINNFNYNLFVCISIFLQGLIYKSMYKLISSINNIYFKKDNVHFVVIIDLFWKLI